MDDSYTFWLVRSQPWRAPEYQYYCVQIPDHAYSVLTGYGQYSPSVLVTGDVIASIPKVDRLTYTALSWEDAQTLLVQYAPFVWLAQGEKYFPTNVEWYFQRCYMAFEGAGGAVYSPNGPPPTMPVLLDYGQITDANITQQSYASSTSHFAQGSYDRSSFYLAFPQAATVTPPTSQPCLAPVYANVIDRTDSAGLLYRDLLYAFFYSYDQATAGSHQADWEHIVVRMDPLSGNILAIFYQTHGQHDTYSNWYYPPDAVTLQTSGTSVGQVYNFFQYYVDPRTNQRTSRCVVYSAIGSHASYTGPGSFKTPGGTTDTTSQGTSWDTANSVLVMDPVVLNWVLYSGLWGDPSMSGIAGNPPSGPAAQQWLTTLNPASPEYHKVIKVSAKPNGYSHQTSRVSTDFSLVANVPIEWTIAGVDASKIAGIGFGLARDRTNQSDIELINGLKNGDVLTLGTVSDLYITNLTYKSPDTGKSYSGSDVFDAIGVQHFQIKADYQTSSAT
ncbi:MAG: hypothetical protein ACOY82_13595 [Pseudomonadota bacterium]